MAKKKLVDVNIFRAGTQTSAQGVVRDFSQSDLKQVADSYNSDVHEAPILIGHEMSDKVPAWGWVKDMKVKGNDLVASIEFSPQMGDYIRDGLYKKVSASFYSPESKINPEPGKWSLRHVAMLGGQPPAVKGLKGFAYSEESGEDGVLDFAVTLSPEAVFDDEHGPTLKSERAPLEQLKEKLEEARTEMAKAEKEQAELKAQAETQAQPAMGQEFAETYDQKKKLVKKVASGKMGAEEAQDEVLEGDADSVDSKENSKAAHDRKLAKKDVSEAEYDKKRGKKKRSGELMADADQDNEDADVDEEDDYREATVTAERQGKIVDIGSSKHDGMPAMDVETADGAGPALRVKPKKAIMDGEAMEDPEKGEYRKEQEEQYEERSGKRKAYHKDIMEGEAMEDPNRGEYKKEVEEALHSEAGLAKKRVKDGEAMQDPDKGEYQKEVDAAYEEDSSDHGAGCGSKYKEGDKKAKAKMKDEEAYAQGYDDRLDETLGDKDGKESSKKQSMKDRRDESKGMEKKSGKKGPFGSDKEMYSEVAVPAGYDVDEYREGFIQAVLAYQEAMILGCDVEYAEDDECTESFDAGVYAGFEFAEKKLPVADTIRNGKPSATGDGPHDKQMVKPDEETDIPGQDTPPAKGPGQPNSGRAKPPVDDSEYQEPTFDPRGPNGSTKKRGSDDLKSSDTGVIGTDKSSIFYEEDSEDHEEKDPFKELPDGASESKDSRPGHPGNVKPGRPDTKKYKSKTKVKATKTLIHGEDGLEDRPSSYELGRQNDQSGRGQTGEAGEDGKTFRASGGKTTPLEGQGTDAARRVTGSDGGAQTRDRMNTGKSSEQAEGRIMTGKAPKGEEADRGMAISLGSPKGSGLAVKSPKVHVEYVGKKPTSDKPLITSFSEMEDRLAELEAANQRLVQEKVAAERAAHRMQLEEFAESLYAHGQLTDAVIDQDDLVDYMEGLEHGTLEFAEGETAATKLMSLLASLPAQVSYSEIAPHNNEEVPMESLDPHEKALRMSKEEGIDYAEALKKSLFTSM